LAERAEDASPSTPGTLALALAALVIALDQASKWWIVAVVAPPPLGLPLAPFLNIVLTRNRGISFGMLPFAGAWGPWLLSALALGVVAALFVWQRRAGSRWISTAVGLIAGGALGNVIDRLDARGVVDFIDVYAGAYHWPAFNLADSAITVGVALLIAEALFNRRERHKS
jgi:signal peptidase II